MTMMRCDARLLGLVADYKAKNDIRFYLRGVHIRRHPLLPGLLIEASDGHQLAIAYDPDGEIDCGCLLLRVDDRAARAALSSKAVKVELRGGRLAVLKPWADDPNKRSLLREEVERLDGDREIYLQPGCAVEPSEWKYPQCDRMLPGGPDDMTETSIGCINADYMARICRTAKLARPGSRFSAVQHYVFAGDRVASRIEDIPNILLITMPMRPGGKTPAFPIFANGLRQRGKAFEHGRPAYESSMSPSRLRILGERVNRDAEEGQEP